MKLRFTWYEQFGKLVPQCRGGPVMSDGCNILACLLTDDGGLPLDHTIRVIDQGLRLIALARGGGSGSANWAREAFAARLTKDAAEILSLYQDDYSVAVGIDALERSLLAWRRFIQSQPAIDVSEEIEI